MFNLKRNPFIVSFQKAEDLSGVPIEFLKELISEHEGVVEILSRYKDKEDLKKMYEDQLNDLDKYQSELRLRSA